MLWCQHFYSLDAFIDELVRHGAIAYDEFPTCKRFNAGLKVEIIGDAPDLRGDKVVAVRVYGNGSSIDGFTLRVWIEDAP